jgi:hypothetical protein
MVTARRKRRFPYCCVRVFSREVFIGPLPSNTRYTTRIYKLNLKLNFALCMCYEIDD